MYHIINIRTQQIVAKCSTIKRARNKVDKKDNEYGAYVHRIEFVSKELGSVSVF